jgi:hypothetical protein
MLNKRNFVSPHFQIYKIFLQVIKKKEASLECFCVRDGGEILCFFFKTQRLPNSPTQSGGEERQKPTAVTPKCHYVLLKFIKNPQL